MSKSKSDVRLYAKRPHLRPTVGPFGDGRTKSEFTKSCDLKHRIKVYQERGVLPGMKEKPGPQHDVDLTAYPDNYHEALNLVARVGQHFAGLPSAVRTKFHNDPKLYLADLEERQALAKEAAEGRARMRDEAQRNRDAKEIAEGRKRVAERDSRVKEAMKEPPLFPPKEG